ncbi:MAG: imidazole glycerol phosphate synthase, glutamine amidotransferase subunit [Bacteroidetes bacterium GWC2_33_15]|nr:MAG: imidazole glycerol phosphate synthase, glutamine amidotransferase subunit [Bacteroidetes bacterium GWA2_33_15]OFX50791.1 MAG: imidazole glycerol phosphate synthase, glutamine amidotransferase subunit [Bacteroidetes bacterium GWC2_33_15]OFX62926.1 MAG: imidazole glycerol phosphate synthase, glutamine amidotransferase subunit [Bacteroidetes bacterium GWB2_32_14]OFX69996.1 MAG: imidazole glycerol phosphate synthase, glutamine amidotransferase subunit [Bacteroidetes bacterium GWD2_33_33]HAN
MHPEKLNIVILDYGMGNLRSVYNKCKRIGYQALISNKKEDILNADKLILPGVGHFANGMLKLAELNLIPVLNEKVLVNKTPILGICLGMQLFCKSSEEGNAKGLGWIDAETVRFKLQDNRYKIPHMGWNSIKPKKESVLFNHFDADYLYYFVHSYYIQCNNQADILATTEYKIEFVSALEKENIFGVQFHPEKSHEWGEQLLKNFIETNHV